MKTPLTVCLLILAIAPAICRAQVSGNIGYSQTGGKAGAEQRERGLRALTKDELPPTATSTFVEASVLMNVKADEFVAWFAVSHEGETLADCSTKMDATLKAFAADLKTAGIPGEDIAVDFIAQNKIYGYQVQGDILQEKLVGFELKKNVSIHYRDPAQIEKLTLAAAKSQIFDLIKVDYIVKDLDGIQEKLMEEATRIAKKKVSRYEKLLDIKLRHPAQVYAEKTAVHYPTRMYDSYTAHESEEVRGGPDRQRYTVRTARKSQTFFFNGLDGNGYDAVINPVVTEPVVQCTLYLKVKYEVEQVKAK